MEVVKFIQKQYPSKIEQMQFTPSIGELKKDFESEVILREEIIKIAASYLSLNIKSKSIGSGQGLMLVVDFILEECSNLELQEINFIFKYGVMGKFGIIYNDISIDTICGKDGWIENYYKEFRKLRKDPDRKECDFRLSGTEMTLKEFHESNPEFKAMYDLHAIFDRAKNFKTTIEDTKQFYKIKGLSLNDFKDDMECFSIFYKKSEYYVNEMQFIIECFRQFIIDNIYKTKG